MKNEQRKSMINVRSCFSESIGEYKCAMEMQYDDFDSRTRTLISNKLYEILEFYMDGKSSFSVLVISDQATP